MIQLRTSLFDQGLRSVVLNFDEKLVRHRHVPKLLKSTISSDTYMSRSFYIFVKNEQKHMWLKVHAANVFENLEN